jgi:hypothetical protein
MQFLDKINSVFSKEIIFQLKWFFLRSLKYGALGKRLSRHGLSTALVERNEVLMYEDHFTNFFCICLPDSFPTIKRV